MTSSNIKQACEEKRLVTPCAGEQGKCNRGGACTFTTHNPDIHDHGTLKLLSKKLCHAESPRKCAQLNDVFAFHECNDYDGISGCYSGGCTWQGDPDEITSDHWQSGKPITNKHALCASKNSKSF